MIMREEVTPIYNQHHRDQPRDLTPELVCSQCHHRDQIPGVGGVKGEIIESSRGGGGGVELQEQTAP